jgi:hypothetical protein
MENLASLYRSDLPLILWSFLYAGFMWFVALDIIHLVNVLTGGIVAPLVVSIIFLALALITIGALVRRVIPTR